MLRSRRASPEGAGQNQPPSFARRRKAVQRVEPEGRERREADVDVRRRAECHEQRSSRQEPHAPDSGERPSDPLCPRNERRQNEKQEQELDQLRRHVVADEHGCGEEHLVECRQDRKPQVRERSYPVRQQVRPGRRKVIAERVVGRRRIQGTVQDRRQDEEGQPGDRRTSSASRAAPNPSRSPRRPTAGHSEGPRLPHRREARRRATRTKHPQGPTGRSEFQSPRGRAWWPSTTCSMGERNRSGGRTRLPAPKAATAISASAAACVRRNGSKCGSLTSSPRSASERGYPASSVSGIGVR